MVIDFHAHYLAYEHMHMHSRTPEGQIVGANRHGEGKELVLESNGAPLGSSCQPEAFYNLPLRLDVMEQNGVDMQVLSPPPFMTFTEIAAPVAAHFAREQNEAVAAAIRQYPDALRGLGIAPWQDPALAIQELTYVLDTLELSGVEMVTQIAGKTLDDPALDAIWRELDTRHALILLHPYRALGTERQARSINRNVPGNTVEMALALVCLAFGGVFKRFPHIRFLAAHGGGMTPFAVGCWEHAAEHTELAHLRSSPLALLRHCYADSIVHGTHELRYLIEILGAERVVLGSDFPFNMGTSQLAALFDASLDATTRRQILSGHTGLLVAGPEYARRHSEAHLAPNISPS